MIELTKTRRILTVFAHPDDETLAAGATLAKLSRKGADIHVAIPATGAFSRRDKQTLSEAEEALRVLRDDCRTALGHLGIRSDAITFGQFPDNEMDGVTLLTVVHWLQKLFDDFRPDLVLTHHKECTNIDHRVCFEAVTVLTRPSHDQHIPVLCGEVPSSTGYRRPAAFEPNIYVNVSSEDVDCKIKSMQSFKSEARADPHPRSPEVLRALAKVRGSEAGFHWAEAFMLLRGFYP
jgi:LmbE family N-acetylglucosaminyl deacetylase